TYNSTSESAFGTSLNNHLNSLSATGSLQNGFYKTTEGKNSRRIYGLVQGRGDISAPASANCTKESINVAFEKSGKRYCMVQCNGDFSRSVCGKCLMIN
ncbi:hypothetical protein CUMW_010370, partial [Citrus unshiu]